MTERPVWISREEMVEGQEYIVTDPAEIKRTDDILNEMRSRRIRSSKKYRMIRIEEE